MWANDGRHVIFATRSVLADPAANGGDIWSLDVTTLAAKPVRFNINLHGLRALDLSRDGKRLLFLDEDYMNELWTGRLPVRS